MTTEAKILLCGAVAFGLAFISYDAGWQRRAELQPRWMPFAGIHYIEGIYHEHKFVGPVTCTVGGRAWTVSADIANAHGVCRIEDMPTDTPVYPVTHIDCSGAGCTTTTPVGWRQMP